MALGIREISTLEDLIAQSSLVAIVKIQKASKKPQEASWSYDYQLKIEKVLWKRTSIALDSTDIIEVRTGHIISDPRPILLTYNSTGNMKIKSGDRRIAFLWREKEGEPWLTAAINSWEYIEDLDKVTNAIQGSKVGSEKK